MKPEAKPLVVAIIGFVVILCVFILIIDPAPMIIQEKQNQHIGEIYGGKVVGQSFVADKNKLTRVDVKFATFARTNTNDIIFKMREADPPKDIVNITVNAAKIKDNSYFGFVFDPIPESQGKSYVFSISSPGSIPGNAITIWYTTEEAYGGGTAILNNSTIQGDLNFKTYVKYSRLDFISSFFKKFTQDTPFFIVYISLLTLILSAVILLYVRRP